MSKFLLFINGLCLLRPSSGAWGDVIRTTDVTCPSIGVQSKDDCQEACINAQAAGNITSFDYASYGGPVSGPTCECVLNTKVWRFIYYRGYYEYKTYYTQMCISGASAWDVVNFGSCYSAPSCVVARIDNSTECEASCDALDFHLDSQSSTWTPMTKYGNGRSGADCPPPPVADRSRRVRFAPPIMAK